jgi:MYXO-CTERM domain-containing protein
MTSKLMKTGRVATLSVAMLIGSLGVNTVMAQTATETPTPATQTSATQTQEKKDSGFDDWGLLGLLGLAGLAGLRKRPERTIERTVGTVERPVNTRTQV